MTIVITWMDDRQEVYRCGSYRVADGVLHLAGRMHTPDPDRSFPIANIRTWTAEDH